MTRLLTPGMEAAPQTLAQVTKPADVGDVPHHGHVTGWDDYHATLAARKKSSEWYPCREARASHYREFYQIQPGDKVLDAGCGHGEYTVWTLQDDARVWAFDKSEIAVLFTNRVVQREGLRAEEVTCQSIMDIQYPSDFFDVVMVNGVLHHLDDPESALREAVRVLRPGGQLYLSVNTACAIHWRAAIFAMQCLKIYPSGKIRQFTHRSVRALIRRTGCRAVGSLGLFFVPPFSGLYTSDMRRLTILPEFMIRPLASSISPSNAPPAGTGRLGCSAGTTSCER